MIHFFMDPDTFVAYTCFATGFAFAAVFGTAFLVNLITEKINTRKDRTR